MIRFITNTWGSCKDLDYGGKPLDGVSHANELLGDQNVPQDNYKKRKEILHYMNPLNIGKLERNQGHPRTVQDIARPPDDCGRNEESMFDLDSNKKALKSKSH